MVLPRRLGALVLGLALVVSGAGPGAGAGAGAGAGTGSGRGLRAPDGDPYQAAAGALLAPPATTPEENTTVQQLLENIAHAPAGATIRLVAFSLNLESVVDALLAARDRGVSVQVVVDGHSRRYRGTRRLAEALGSDRAQASYVILTRRSARGVGRKGELHQKTWMFSQTGSSRAVVMVGSMNLTEYGTTMQYTDMYTFVGRSDVWSQFNRIFEQQALDQPAANRPNTVRMHDVTAFFGPGYRRATDPVQRVLDSISPRSTIRVGAFAWYDGRGVHLADAVTGLARRGARIRILTGIHVSRPIKRQLRQARLTVFRGSFAGGQNIHFKMLLVHDREKDRRFLLTGSDNWSNASYRKDDLDVVIPLTKREYRTYVAYFESVVDRSLAEYPHQHPRRTGPGRS